jgi:hypothetical protein
MREPLALIDDPSRRPDDQPRAIEVAGYRYLGGFWLGFIVLGITFWTGIGFGIRALVTAF